MTTRTTLHRRVIDWLAIETDFKAGSMSVREIARHHGLTDTAVRKRARQAGWARPIDPSPGADALPSLVARARNISAQMLDELETIAPAIEELEVCTLDAANLERLRHLLMRAVALAERSSVLREIGATLRELRGAGEP